MRDKDIPGIVREASRFADSIIITQPRFERAADPKTILQEVKKHTQNVQIVKDVGEAVNQAISKAHSSDVICISGSIFNVGEAIKMLSNSRVDEQ
jgi:dihydrofolate synthase/folylpolyglutamate synthase